MARHAVRSFDDPEQALLNQRRRARSLNFEPAGWSLTFGDMKRYLFRLLLLSFLAGWGGLPTDVSGQSTAAILAEREAAEDRYRRLAERVDELVANQALRQQQIAALEKENRELREEINRLRNSIITSESLNRLAEQIQKVDQARVAENRKIVETIEELHRIVKAAATAPPPSRGNPSRSHSSPSTVSEVGFEYVVQKGDTLSGIVQAYRLQNIKVNMKAVMDANPNVDWNRLQVGHKLFIPKP